MGFSLSLSLSLVALWMDIIIIGSDAEPSMINVLEH
jgi:hypothetical protein